MLLELLVLAAPQTTWFVDGSFPTGGDGSAANPYSSIQTATDASTTQDGDTISIADGVYAESIVVDGLSVTFRPTTAAADVVVEPAVAGATTMIVRGGSGAPVVLERLDLRAFDDGRVFHAEGSSVVMTEVDLSAGGSPCAPWNCQPMYGLLIDGGADVTMVGCSVTGFVPQYVSPRLLSGSGVRVVGSSLSMDSCSIVGNGYEGNGWDELGGGLFVDVGATVVLHSCDVSENVAAQGSGVYSLAPSFEAHSCTFTGNGNYHNSAYGGGLYGYGRIEDSLIARNYTGQGSGVYGAFELIGCLIEDNQGADGSAYYPAVYSALVGGSRLVRTVVRDHHAVGIPPNAVVRGAELVDSLVEGNDVYHGDGPGAYGAVLTDCRALRCIIRGNWVNGGSYAALGGGALDSELVDCVLEGNRSVGSQGTRGGGAMDSTLIGCLLIGNEADEAAAADDCELDRCVVTDHVSATGGAAIIDSTVRNSIVWENGPFPFDQSVAEWSCVDVSPSVAASLGIGNITQDPLFWSQVGGDFHLRPGSPCIDQGDPAMSDPDGTRLDMGAFPFDALYVPPPLAYCQPKTDLNGCAPRVSADRQPSASTGVATVTAAGTAGGQFGLFFLGRADASVPHYEGTLCVGGTLQRSSALSAGGSFGACDGVLQFQMGPAQIASMGFSVGESILVQAAYRTGPVPLPDALGLSDAVHLIVQP